MEKLLLDQSGIEKILKDLAKQVRETEKGGEPYSLVGIHTRGIPLARRMAVLLNKDQAMIGTLDINLYRDDLSTVADMPVVRETFLPFAVEKARILLVDDVLFTGRTIRSALDALIDLGRPQEIKLLVLVDRGGREFPIQADFCGKIVEAKPGNIVKVRLKETDGVDEVKLK